MSDRDVFVVYGRNVLAKDAMFTFLRSIDLRPLEWETIVAETGQASPYVGEILNTGFRMAQAAVVLFTGDDEARLRPELQNEDEPDHECIATPQARPNVLLEAGMALGMFPERTVLVELGVLRPTSDLLGRHTIRMNNSAERRRDLVGRLRTAGCAVDDTANAWVNAGDFEAAIVPAGESEDVEDLAATLGELSEAEKNLLVLMLYNAQRCLSTRVGPQPNHIETEERAIFDPDDPELALTYVLALNQLTQRGYARWASAGDRGVKHRLTDDGIAMSAQLREGGWRFDMGNLPAARARPSRI